MCLGQRDNHEVGGLGAFGVQRLSSGVNTSKEVFRIAPITSDDRKKGPGSKFKGTIHLERRRV